MRIYLAIDGSNFLHAQRDHLRWMADPGRLRLFVGQWGEIVRADYYLSVFPTEATEKQERYRKALYHMGYSVASIPIKIIQTENGGKEKADADVRMVLDIFMALDTFDMLVLVSGDSDFCYLLEQLKARGKLVKVISTKGVVANEMLECVGQDFCDFEDIKAAVVRNGQRI